MNDRHINLHVERCGDLLRLRVVAGESAPMDVCHVVPTTMLLQLFQLSFDSPSIEDDQWGVFFAFDVNIECKWNDSIPRKY
jgi:hypothetical protein